MQKFLSDVGLSVVWAFIGVVLLYLATVLFDKFDPLDIRKMIKEGNIAAGVLLGALAIGIAIIIAAAIG
ncbi:MAG TPA: DUF350 domain-containing protein [Thermomicrobiales bacterium]|nr:DUF350 domain-containing protein [Thermomicrobiales bacterium]